MTDRERIVRRISQTRDAARARLLTQHRKLARVRERNQQRAERQAQQERGDRTDGDEGTDRAGRPQSSRDDVPGSWSSVPERPPTRDETPTAPHRPRLYGHRLRRRANGTEDDE
ncbi:hypothetical protein [Natrinema longum]|uniref:Protein gvpI n=1 Tax=Natrinema longum TaxID=370324 RepID=A0A8A2U5S0_9EURY|nr:hypothetical protein [Natrinema longum]MBZ6494607.1 hypothetical protein [Natrinema longum]QSW84074.1 hypothetical protein J0X27_11465 [Natrinema longum]